MTDTSEPNDRALRLTQAEATVLRELGRQEQGASKPRLADAYRRLLQLARSENPIDSILAAHLVREVLSTTPRAVGIELVPERLEYENKVAELSRAWPAAERVEDPPPAVATKLRRLLEEHDRATGRAQKGPRALLAQQDAARTGYVPDLSIRRWIDLSRRGSQFAHRIKNLEEDLPSPAEARRLVDELTATLLAAIAPFYIGIGELDALLALETPTRPDAERVADLLRTPAQHAYFFDRASERWLRPLASVRRMFESPPDLVDVGGGYVRTPDWPQGRFLARVAPSDPDFVVSIVEQVRDSKNPVVVGQIVKVALALPAPHAVRLVDRISARMSVPLAVEYASIEAVALAQSLTQADHTSPASKLLLSVVDAAIASPRDAEWYLERALGNPIDAIAKADGDIGLELRRRLMNAVDRAGPLRHYSTMLVRRIDLRPHHPDRIWFLANALFRALLASPLESAKALTSTLLNDPQRTLGRVALVAVPQRPELLDRSDVVLLQAVRFDDANTTRYEFRRALGALWETASTDAREALLRYAQLAEEAAEISERLRADQVVDAPGPTEVRRQWRSLLLFRIRENIPADWLEKLGPLDPLEDHGLAEPTVETVTPVSPVTEDELAMMEPDAVIGLLHQWATSENARFDIPGPEGLAIATANTVVSRIQQFRHLGSKIAGTKPRFVAAITAAIERGLREDQIQDHATAVSFSLALGEAFLQGRVPDISSREVRRNIAEIIALGATRNALNETAGVTALRLLRLLLRDIDPTPEWEQSDVNGHYNPGILALNSVRGAATTAMIELLLQSRRAERTELADEIADALRAAIGGDYARAVRAAVGMRLPWLLDRDASHCSQWLSLLFGADAPDVASAATWDAYLLYSRFFTNTAALLAEQYTASVARLDARPEDDHRRLVIETSDLASTSQWPISSLCRPKQTVGGSYSSTSAPRIGFVRE